MGLFDRFKKKEEEPVTVIDPEIEKLREEKFNMPVIEDEEDIEEKEVKKEIKKEVKPAPKPYSNMNLGKNNSPAQSSESPYSIYKSREIISPMMGRTEKKVEEEIKPKPNKKKVSYTDEDAINPVFSPFFGTQISAKERQKIISQEKENEVAKEMAKTEKTQVKTKAESKTTNKTTIKAENKVQNKTENKSETAKTEIKAEENTEENILSKEEPKSKKNKKDVKKETESKIEAAIVEQSTGEFKLDFPEEKNDDGKLMDEIGDEMTLDELLSLYENKNRKK